MKMYLISDNADTQTGLRLVGIGGALVRTREDLIAQFEKVVEDKEIGIVLIVEKLARQFPDIVDDIRLNRKLPLVVEIPDRHGTGRSSEFITEYMRSAIGVKI